MATEVALLIAAERSGTHMMRSMLSGTSEVAALGEVCNAVSSDSNTSPTSFLRFRAEQCVRDARFFYPTTETQTQLLDLYFEHVRALFPKKRLVILDIKYSHVHNFNAFWWDFVSPPFLLDYAVSHRMKVVHLVREKPYQTIISDIYAQRSGVWRTKDPSEVPKLKIRIDSEKLKLRTSRLVRTIFQFEQWLKACNTSRVTYEALTQDGRSVLEQLLTFFELCGPARVQSSYLRTTPPYQSSIENYEEIAPFVAIGLNEVL
jgi:hypothetical protein